MANGSGGLFSWELRVTNYGSISLVVGISFLDKAVHVSMVTFDGIGVMVQRIEP